MSTYFSKIIKAGDRLREFNFRQSSPKDKSRFTIDVPDQKGNRIMFSIFKNEQGEWKLSEQLIPGWVHEAEQDLAAAIEEHQEAEMTKKGS